MSIIPSASPNDTTTALSPEREAEIRAELAAIPAPPWRWIGSRNAGGPELVTDHSGRQYLLRATKPTDHRGDELLDPETDDVVYGDLQFRDQREGETYSTMRSGNTLAVGRTEYDPDAIVGVANPVARWIETSALNVTELLAEVDRLRAEVDRLNKSESWYHNELTGANLSLYEEELDNARLRLALASAQRGRRELRAKLAGLRQGYAVLEARCNYIAKAAVSWRKEADGRKEYGLTLRAELAEQALATEYFANQSRRRGNQLAADPSRRQVTPVEAFAYDMDQALIDLSADERRGADLVLQVLRARATAADIPTAEDAS